MPPLQRRENGRRLSFLLTLCHSRKLVPDVSNRGSSVLMNPVSFSLLLSVIPDPDRGSSQGKNPGSLCSRRGGIPGQSPGHASCRPRGCQETESAMRRKAARCGHYRGGVPGGIRWHGYGRGREADGRRHEMPPLQRMGPRGRGKNAPASGATSGRLRVVAAPRSRSLVGGEDCLSEASSAAQTFGTGAKAPEGPRPGAHGFGSFCRNKRISPSGDETPQGKRQRHWIPDQGPG